MVPPDETTQLLAKPVPESDQGHGEYGGPIEKINIKFSSREILGLGAAFLGILLAEADSSLVWATHETVASQFDGLRNASWMMTSYTIGYCVTLPLYGQLSDSYGRLRPIVAAYCIFCAGCFISGLGQAYWQIILGRIITGFAASGMTSVASIIITDLAPPSDVAILRSYVNLATTCGLSLGGPLGGFLAGTVGWRWSFLGQVPIAAVCCLLIRWSLGTILIDHKEEHLKVTEPETKPNLFNFDFPGAISLAIAVSSLLVIINLKATLTWSHVLVLASLVAGLLSMVVFFIAETQQSKRKPLVPLWLLRTEVGAFCGAQVLILGGRYAFLSHIAPYFSRTQGLSDAAAGSYIVPSFIGNAVGALVAGQAIKSLGSYKKLSLAALFLNICISAFIIFSWSHTIGSWEGFATFPLGFCAGIILSTQFIGLSTSAPKQHMATAISMYYMSQQIGVAIGISVSSGLLVLQFKEKLMEKLVDVPGYQEIIKSVLSDSSFTLSLPFEVKQLVWQCYLNSFWVVPTIYTLAYVIAIVPMASAPEKRWK